MTDANEFTIPGLNLINPVRPISEGKDPLVRLLGRMDLGDTSFHVEAEQVHMVPDDAGGEYQESMVPDVESRYASMADAAGGDGPFETIEIPGLPGRNYVLFIYPFCT